MSVGRAPVEVYDPALAEARRAGDEEGEIALIARVIDTQALPPGVRTVSRFGDIVTLRAKRKDLERLADCPAAVDLEAVRQLRPPIPPDRFGEAVDIDGQAEPTGYTRRPDGLRGAGAGVIVASIDYGFDIAHPAFRRPDGSTRFVALWDQRGLQGGGRENRWGYGRIFTRGDIERALASSDPYAALGYHPADAATVDTQTGQRVGPSHGTHVLSIAAGSVYDGGMSGVAPESDLLAVHLAHTAEVVGPANLGDSASAVEAFDFVFATAGDRPTVVNVSIGAQGGSHDGSSLGEQAIDQAIELGHQKVVVFSAGNYARAGAHRHGRLRQGEQAKLTVRVPRADPTPSELEIWYSGADRFTVTVFGPDGSALGSARPGGVVPLGDEPGPIGRLYHVRSARNGRHLINLLLAPRAPGGDWVVELTAESVPAGDGRFYSWIEREGGPRPRFVPDNDDPRTTTGSLSNGRLTIGVGAYDPYSPDRPIAVFSSGGPTVVGLVKPEIVAPGVCIPAARSTPRGGTPGPTTAVMSGTSMAAPHVTGIVAVMLGAADKTLDVYDVRAILLATASRPHLGPHHVDVNRVGAGYLDPVAAERAVLDDHDGETFYDTSEFTMNTSADEWVPNPQPSESEEWFAGEEQSVGGVADVEVLGDEAAGESPLQSPLQLTPMGPVALPEVLAGPMVRRAEADAVWFWIACSQEISAFTPDVTVYNPDGSLAGRMALAPATPQVARLGEHMWVAIVAARPTNQKFETGPIYGYNFTIGLPNRTSRLTLSGIAYKPFDRPTFRLGSRSKNRIAHGSCRRPGGYGADACVVFDKWVEGEVSKGTTGKRPTALFLTGDQIYADDVAYPLFQAVRRLAADVFGYDEQLPPPTGTRGITTAQLKVNDWRGMSWVSEWFASARARLTRRPPKNNDLTLNQVVALNAAQAGSPGEPSRPNVPAVSDRDVPGRIGFTTEDGEGHLLSFAEFAAMYLLVWNPDLWRRYVSEQPGSDDDDTDNLTGFAEGAQAARRLMANMPTYMMFDDHEITDDWNLDGDWSTATNNPMARRIISNGLAAYWAFQAWGNDPSQFDAYFVSTVTQHLADMSASKGRPGPAARSFDHTLHAQYWAYAAPTQPPVLCVDTRTRREFLPNGKTVLSGKSVYPHLQRLVAGGGFTRGEPLTIVLPTPLLGHRSTFYVQNKYHPWPRDRYEGDYELYGNNADQRPDLIWFVRSLLNAPALIVLSGDVHHGFVIDGLYAGAKTLEEIYRGNAAWAMQVVQITSSAIKNIKKSAFVDNKLLITDAGKVGQILIPKYENQYKTMPDGTKIAQRAAARKLNGDLGRKTYIFENHLCVVDFEPTKVNVLFIGDLRDSKAAFAWGLRRTLRPTVLDATTSVDLANNPATFIPPLNWLWRDWDPRPVGMKF
ncbi:S8 family serine peptidase [Mycobacterium sp. NPDC048908]|uniref:S8 family serine peptidase n=1 Tax=Mycobacterium sp. NPDC048908 TaxID=3364292 RepID=UPI00371E2377